MNTVLLSGTVSVAAAQKTFQSGATLTTATIRVAGFAKKGEAPRTDDVQIEAWHEAGKALMRTSIGAKVIVTGKVRVNAWTAQDGSPRSRTSIVADSVEQLVGDGIAATPAGREPGDDYEPASAPASAASDFVPAPGDEIPF